MEQIKSTIYKSDKLSDSLFSHLPKLGSYCIFDIETTGLSAKISSVYLIGAAIWQNDHFQFRQWFANDYTSEKELLQSFSDFTKDCEGYIHYNGTTFDIPYLNKKYTSFHLPSPFDRKESVDIYRMLPKDKNFFKTTGRKLTDMEKIAGFQREDHFSGKECIQIYADYMQQKYFQNDESEVSKKKLLKHNKEDIMGTIYVSRLLTFFSRDLIPESFSIEENTWIINSSLSFGTYPFDHCYEREEKDGTRIAYTYKDNTLTLRIPLFRGTLFYFFKDYKNYFYLPAEDMAVHKSVGIYVEKENREPARAANCYVRKEGLFLPVPFDETSFSGKLYRSQVRSRHNYITADDFALLNEEQKKELFLHLLNF